MHKIKKPVVINNGRIKVAAFGSGIKIYWDNSEVTQGLGLNVSIDTFGMWTDSSLADWYLLEKKKDYFKIRIIFKDLPLSQIWVVSVENEQQLKLEVSASIDKFLHVDEFRLNCFISSCYKTWINNYREGNFPRLHNDWLDVYYDDTRASLVGARLPVKDGFLNAFVLEGLNEGKDGFPIQ